MTVTHIVYFKKWSFCVKNFLKTEINTQRILNNSHNVDEDFNVQAINMFKVKDLSNTSDKLIKCKKKFVEILLKF